MFFTFAKHIVMELARVYKNYQNRINTAQNSVVFPFYLEMSTQNPFQYKVSVSLEKQR